MFLLDNNFLIYETQDCEPSLIQPITLSQDEEFAEIIHSSDRIEFMYSHLFDETIINADLSAAFERLVSAVIRVETDPLWVPTSWVQ